MFVGQLSVHCLKGISCNQSTGLMQSTLSYILVISVEICHQQRCLHEVKSVSLASYYYYYYYYYYYFFYFLFLFLHHKNFCSCCFASNCVPSLDRTTASFQSKTEDSDQSLYFIADTTRHI